MKYISFSTLRSLCRDIVIFLVPTAIALYFLPGILSILSPFIAGVFLYLAANPLKTFLQKQGLHRSLCAFLSLGLICTAVFTLIRIIGGKIFEELVAFTQNPPEIYSAAVEKVTQKFSDFSRSKDAIPGIKEALSEGIGRLVSSVSNFLINFAKGIPSFLIAAFAAVFTAFFLLKDGERIFAFFPKFFGEKFCDGFVKFKNKFLSVASSYLKAQLIIEGIIFLILVTGFLLLKVKYAFMLALITAAVDAVPVFGTGTILIPMGVFNLLSENNALGWGLIALYGITLVTRQLCEPKILGKAFGIHPLAAVFSIYVGMRLFGIAGLIFGPFLAIFLKIFIFSR